MTSPVPESHCPRIWKAVDLDRPARLPDAIGFREMGVALDAASESLLESAAVAGMQTERGKVGVVRLRVSDLGYKSGATLKAIIRKATLGHLRLCPPDLAPRLRLQYLDQPDGDALRVASERIGSTGAMFVLRKDGEVPTLSWDDASPAGFWDAERSFLFRT